jgi:hypothetical protein
MNNTRPKFLGVLAVIAIPFASSSTTGAGDIGSRLIFTYEQVKQIFRKKIYVPLWEMDYRAA